MIPKSGDRFSEKIMLKTKSLILCREPPLHAPACKHGFDLLGNKETRTVLVVGLIAQPVIVGEDVAHIGDEREPGSLLGRGLPQAAAIERVIDHGAELMVGNAGCELSECAFDIGASGHERSDGSRQCGWASRVANSAMVF